MQRKVLDTMADRATQWGEKGVSLDGLDVPTHVRVSQRLAQALQSLQGKVTELENAAAEKDRDEHGDYW